MDMYSTSAPSSGAWLGLCLKILENLGLSATKFKANPARIYHQFVEAFKYSYALGSYLSDMRFSKEADKVCALFSLLCVMFIIFMDDKFTIHQYSKLNMFMHESSCTAKAPEEFKINYYVSFV